VVNGGCRGVTKYKLQLEATGSDREPLTRDTRIQVYIESSPPSACSNELGIRALIAVCLQYCIAFVIGVGLAIDLRRQPSFSARMRMAVDVLRPSQSEGSRKAL
jgi:hypothetical protein